MDSGENDDTCCLVQNSIILHDNARSHTAAVTDLLRRWQWEILEHPPYSPYESMRLRSLRPSERTLRGTRYNTIDELILLLGGQCGTLTEMNALMV